MLALLLVACDKDNTGGDNGGSIEIAVTKNTLSPDSITTGTQIKLYDCVTKNGTAYTSWIDGNTASYPSSGSTWVISGEPTGGYSWWDGTDKMDHHFFGWLTRDKNGLTDADLFSSALTASASDGVYTVNVPATTMTLATTQFDFAYSDMVNRTVADPDYSTVDIHLKHLFTCFGIKAHNYTEDPVTIKQVKIYGLTNRKSATITYDATAGTVDTTYTSVSKTWASASDAVSLMDNAHNITLAADADTANVINGISGAGSDYCYLMWPQNATELADCKIIVTYNNGGSDETKELSIRPDGADFGWDAGTRHIIEIGFIDKEVKLTVKTLPWDHYTPTIDYNGSISVKSGGQLTLKEPGTFCTLDTATNKVYFKSGNPITIYFTFDTPLDATWMITKKGDWDYFEIDNADVSNFGDKTDYNYGTIDGQTSTVTIYPKVDDPDKTYEIQLSFAVRTNSGKVLSADKLIQGPDSSKYYKFVLGN